MPDALRFVPMLTIVKLVVQGIDVDSLARIGVS
jgi:hypothetical protein